MAAQLDPSKRCGIWWYNRRRVMRPQVSETGPEGRRYRRRSLHTPKEKDEWIVVPVPDSGIRREGVDAAREAVKHNRKLSLTAATDSFWERSGGAMYCDSCGRRMAKHTASYTRKSGEKARRHFYHCPKAVRHSDMCSLAEHFRADRLELRIWKFISTMLRDPDRLRVGLERMIEEECKELRGDPELEIKMWLDRVAEVDRRRGAFHDMAAESLITFEELRAKLAELEETREVAEKGLKALQTRRERMMELQRDHDVLLKSYSEIVPEALESLTPEERHRVYRMLRLWVAAHADETLAVSGVLQDPPKARCDSAATSADPRSRRGSSRTSCGAKDSRTRSSWTPRGPAPGTSESRPTSGRRGAYPQEALDLSRQRARRIAPDDCDDFDYVLTMGEENYRTVASLCRGSAVVRPFLDFAKATTLERGVPDPFYGGSEGFEHVLNLVGEASEGLLENIRERDLSCRD